ncbi:MAG TPA: Xaa-Pro aminopeptidase [Cyanobacteria bacterium UBA11367]|nr:Xaa-Pro aminopeptidase [Cyanobacteria bacterium UBA11367]
MIMANNYTSPAKTLKKRRQRLAQFIDFPVMLWSGCGIGRNFPANRFPFRASSHFLYFAGLPLEKAVIYLHLGKLELFIDDYPPESILWHGAMPKREEIAEKIGADEAFPLSELRSTLRSSASLSRAEGVATIPVQDIITRQEQGEILQRPLGLADNLMGIDRDLAIAIASLRLYHDENAIAQLRQAAAVTIEAHKTGMRATNITEKNPNIPQLTTSGKNFPNPSPQTNGIYQTEATIRGAMAGIIMAHNLTCAYNPIVTVHGEVLHNEKYHHPLQPGDLLLADVGAENQMGWASDVTRTWPVTGKFSATQRDIYNIVLAAHDACIAKIRPDVEYQDIHLLAASVICQGLVDLGILRGEVSDLVEMDAHALFFPHGVGHLLGLDVHDMEDLGDLAGYAEGRIRSNRFGLCFLRLNRPLQSGMLVTIEPGFYQVPGILNDPEQRVKYRDIINWERLAKFADVRGIRIEDDILVTEEGCEVLTGELPTAADAIEDLVN